MGLGGTKRWGRGLKSVDLSGKHVLKKRSRLIQIKCTLYINLPFPGFSLHFTKGYARYKSKEVKNNLMELTGSNGSFTCEVNLKINKFKSASPLVRKKNKLSKNTKEIRMCQNPLSPAGECHMRTIPKSILQVY